MNSHLRLIADDYGLSPGTGGAIRELLALGGISGTSCMTLFPEWKEQAELLCQVLATSKAEIGLHLTLTDFLPLSDRLGRRPMSPLTTLIKSSIFGSRRHLAIEAELDAQLNRFVDEIGRLPDFIDGHQHIHFLHPVREWLKARRGMLESRGRLPWLRGAPSIALKGGNGRKLKTGVVKLLARDFDNQMKAVGYRVHGPLLGFYHWRRPTEFLQLLNQADALSHKAVMMCHAGWIDDVLVARDKMIRPRRLEFEALKRRMSL